MIPSSPRRTWLFLGASMLLYFAPDLLLPAAWLHGAFYPLLSKFYQSLLVLVGFAYGPAICRALVVREIDAGPQYAAVSRALATLSGPPLVLADHSLPFILTAGLLPRHCQVFVSSALVARLSPIGLRFLLARAAAHASLRQRLAALLPVLVLTTLPDDFAALSSWLLLGASLLLWLPYHWLFELDADRQAARRVGEDSSAALLEVLAATASPLDRYLPHPPLLWRLRALERWRQR